MYVLIVLLFANADFKTVIDVEMQDFASQQSCEAAGKNLLGSAAHIQWKCEPK
jgi:hypothetical protein